MKCFNTKYKGRGRGLKRTFTLAPRRGSDTRYINTVETFGLQTEFGQVGGSQGLDEV